MIVHAIDIGASAERSTCGIAELDTLKMHMLLAGGEDLIRTRTIGGHELTQVVGAVQHAASVGARVVVENPYFSMKFGNPKVFEMLVVVKTRFVDLCAIYGVPCVVLYASQWQPILKHVPVGAVAVHKKTQKLTKLQAKYLARQIYGDVLAGRTEHEIDAALMGRWWGFGNGS